MNTKIPEKLKKMIRDCANDYRYCIGANKYVGDIFYAGENKKGEWGRNIEAEIATDHRYLTADITVYPCLVEKWIKKEKSDEDIKKIIAHEIAHIATHKLNYLATCVYKDEGETVDAWESLTEIVGRLIYKVNNKNDTRNPNHN